MRDYYQNRYIGIFFNMPEENLIKSVAESFFAKTDSSLLNVLNSTFIEGCVDEFIQNQTVELDLDDLPENQDGWTKPSRKNRGKHDKKAARRKGSAKRFRDRSRKYAHERHLYKVYDRGLAGDWNRRGRRLENAGATSTKTSHHKAASGECQRPMGINLHISNVYYPDGSQISVEMGSEDWYSYVGELATLKKRIEQEEQERQERLERQKDDHQKWDFWDWDDEDDDWMLKESELPAPCKTWIFSVQELADFMQKLASATPEQRAMVREFFNENF